MVIDGERQFSVARYDTAHGVPHRDVLGRRKGLIRKDWLFGVVMDTALQDAIADFKANYEDYIKIYETQ